MATLNHCSFIGHLGKDPELTVTSDGKPITKFSLAVDQGKDETMWLNITCWDKLAEFVEMHVHKGMQVFVQGKLKKSKYKKDGVQHETVEVIATNVQLLEKKRQQKGEEAELPDEVLP